MKNQFQILVIIILISTISCKKKGNREDGYYDHRADKTVVYKKVESAKLKLKFFYPSKSLSNTVNPAMIFFFGGSWVDGASTQFAPQAEYYSKKGFVTILADYRVKSKHNSTPFDALKDAKSAIRYVKKNAYKHGINSSKIIAIGASTGGHMAAATAIIEAYNDELDEINISPSPAALILFNPVIDNGPDGFGYEIVKEQYKLFSPLHNLKMPAPPTIILSGSKDIHVPVKTIMKYKSIMDSLGSICVVKIYEDQKHGFFNYRYEEYYNKTISDIDAFLISLGYL